MRKMSAKDHSTRGRDLPRVSVGSNDVYAPTVLHAPRLLLCMVHVLQEVSITNIVHGKCVCDEDFYACWVILPGM